MVQKSLYEKIKRKQRPLSNLAYAKSVIEQYFVSKNNKNAFLTYRVITGFCILLSLVAAFLLNNPFLLPALIILSFLLPFMVTLSYIKLEKQKIKTGIISSINLISTIYYRDKDFYKALLCSLPCMPKEGKTIFEDLQRELACSSFGMEHALRKLKEKMPSFELGQWCSQILLCQKDRKKIESLPAIIDNINEKELICEKRTKKLRTLQKEYVLLLLIYFAAFPLFRKINPLLFSSLTDSTVGKCVVAISFLFVTISIWKVFSFDFETITTN